MTFRLTKAGNEEPQDERSLYETIKLCDTILGRKPYVLGALFSSELDGFGSSFSSRSIGPAKPDPLGIGGGFSCCCSGTSAWRLQLAASALVDNKSATPHPTNLL